MPRALRCPRAHTERHPCTDASLRSRLPVVVAAASAALGGRRTRTYCVTTVPIFTTSKSLAFTLRSVASASSLQRGSGAPETYHALPLSASSIPYVFIAFRITCTSGGKDDT